MECNRSSARCLEENTRTCRPWLTLILVTFSYPWIEQHRRSDLTRAREWGPELRAREGGGAESVPPANSAPMKAEITKFLWEVGWLKISIMRNFGDPRSISSEKKIKFQKIPKFCKNADLRVFSSGRKTIIARNDS